MFTLKVECDPGTADLRGSSGARAVQTWRDLSGEVCAFGYAGPGWWEMEWPRVGAFRFGPAFEQTVQAIPEPGVSVGRIEEVYRRSVLPLVYQALGRETLHASAVTGSRGVLAFCGERGAGKSTVAYGLCRRGFAQHADDTLVLTITSTDVTTHPLPFVPRLRPASAEYFDADPATHALCKPSMPQRLAALFILRQSAQEDPGVSPLELRQSAQEDPGVSPLEPAAAFRAVLAHAHSFDPQSSETRRRVLQNYLEISARVQVFDVAYAPDLGRLDALLDALMAAAGETLPTPVRV